METQDFSLEGEVANNYGYIARGSEDDDIILWGLSLAESNRLTYEQFNCKQLECMLLEL